MATPPSSANEVLKHSPHVPVVGGEQLRVELAVGEPHGLELRQLDLVHHALGGGSARRGLRRLRRRLALGRLCHRGLRRRAAWAGRLGLPDEVHDGAQLVLADLVGGREGQRDLPRPVAAVPGDGQVPAVGHVHLEGEVRLRALAALGGAGALLAPLRPRLLGQLPPRGPLRLHRGLLLGWRLLGGLLPRGPLRLLRGLLLLLHGPPVVLRLPLVLLPLLLPLLLHGLPALRRLVPLLLAAVLGLLGLRGAAVAGVGRRAVGGVHALAEALPEALALALAPRLLLPHRHPNRGPTTLALAAPAHG
mmetsp:Transcript_84735/g.189294  ORF Transcript_84735/g.189294 Transcript_84735/m.189294 type:complete len:305 (+) Transcript_84735:288-1202(+)